MQLPPKVTDRAFARLAEIGAASVQEIIGTIQTAPQPPANVIGAPVA